MEYQPGFSIYCNSLVCAGIHSNADAANCAPLKHIDEATFVHAAGGFSIQCAPQPVWLGDNNHASSRKTQTLSMKSNVAQLPLNV
jgi:hypothetical protein